MEQVENFGCMVNPKDQMVSYTCTAESVISFAVVLTNGKEQKISVLLTVEDALRLREQLNTFIIQSAIRRA